MSLLSKVTSGIVKRPHYLLMHGLPGLGKSTFASEAPSPIFLCAEKGTGQLDVNRLELDDFNLFLDTLDELATTKHDFKTVVIDTVDHLETLIFKEVVKDKQKKSIEDIGYAKGYIFALDYWNKLVSKLELLREKGMNVIVLAHTEIKAFQDPQLAEGYDRYQIKLHQKAAAIFVDRVDCVLFVNYETFLKSEEYAKTKAFGEGKRVIYTENRPAFVAKNRFDLPFKMQLIKGQGWSDFSNACANTNTKSAVDIKKNIDELLLQVKDPEIRKGTETYMTSVGTDTKKMLAIENKLRAIVAQ